MIPLSEANTSKLKRNFDMKLGKTFKCLRNFCYITCLVLFLFWLFNAVKNYLSLPTTTHVFMKYGDDNLKNAKFPSLTICKLPMETGNELKLWKGVKPCINNSRWDSPAPYFLSYLEACLESENNETVEELISKVTYNATDNIMDIGTYPAGSTVLTGKEFRNYANQIVASNYHYNYGHCLTVDISPLSNNSGLFPMEYNDKKLELYVNFFNVEEASSAKINQFFFLHHGRNINLLGKDVRAETTYGATHIVS